MVAELFQPSAHATGIEGMAGGHTRCFFRAAGDVGLLRGRFRDHLGFLVSHFEAPFRGDFPHFVFI